MSKIVQSYNVKNIAISKLHVLLCEGFAQCAHIFVPITFITMMRTTQN